MSLQDGMAAINLEMPDRVPRTEYSAETDVIRQAIFCMPINAKTLR